jgi:intraflagellar transport protein 140
LKNTYYQLAKHFERMGDFDQAIQNYIKSETHRTEVPRMLCKNLQFDKLESFVEMEQDPEIFKWWGQYLESKQNYDGAMKYYKQAKDNSSLVRLYSTVKKDFNLAKQTAIESQDPSACYHLARTLEGVGQIREAIQFYSKSQRFHHAVRLARDHAFDNDVLTMS